MSQRSEQTTELVEQRVKEQSPVWIWERKRGKETERERGQWLRVQGGSTPRGDLSPPFFGNRRRTFETVPIEAGLNPCSWNFYKLGVREQEEESRRWDLGDENSQRLAHLSSLLSSDLTWDFESVKKANASGKFTKKDPKRHHGEGEDKEYMKKKMKRVTSHWKLSWILPEERFEWLPMASTPHLGKLRQYDLAKVYFFICLFCLFVSVLAVVLRKYIWLLSQIHS